MRRDDQRQAVKNIPLEQLKPFKNHPFQVRDDEEFRCLVESIEIHGVIHPAVARQIGEDCYELISGHRRKAACELLGYSEMPVLVRSMTDDEAVVNMVDANLQRETILPSERAFAYKMKLVAMSHQGRKGFTSAQLGRKCVGKESRELIAEQVGQSRNQISRYIRLTELIPEILEMVDNRKMALNPAVSITLSDAMGRILMDEPLRPGEGILHHPEGVDLMPADIQLSGMEVSLVNAMSRETILRQYLDTLKGQYSHILIDCQPSLGMLTVNALAAANRVIIPVQAEYLPAKGLEQLLSTVSKVKRQINPKLQIDGILLTMVDNRTNFAKEIAALLRETYGSKIKVFGTEIPHSVRAKEISAEGKSIFAHDPNGKVAERYKSLTKEVLKLEKQREKSRAGSIR